MGSVSWFWLITAFTGGASLVWWAGMRLPVYVAAIEAETGLGKAFAGMVLLGGITTLPELATAGSAAVIGAGELAVNNSLGSVCFNMVLLAIGDAVFGRSALTSIIVRPATLLQGVLGMLLLALTAAAIGSDDIIVLGAGLWSWLLLASVLLALWVASRYEERPSWKVVEPPPSIPSPEVLELSLGLRALLLRTSGLALLILAGGSILAQTGDEIAVRSGLDAGLIGFLLISLATSLPELSTVIGAMRRRHYELAVGDIFGANLFNVAIIFVVDAAHAGPPVLSAIGSFETGAALLGLVLTGLFVIGLLERRDRVLWRMGYDSIAVVGIYLVGVSYLASVETT